MGNSFTATQRKEKQRIVQSYLDTYREFKYQRFERKEAQITGSYEARYHGPTGVTSDSTARIGLYNVWTPIMRREFCERIERAVDRLPVKELKAIRFKYLSKDTPLDQQVAKILGISKTSYIARRDAAFIKLASLLKLEYEVILKNQIDSTED